MRRTVLVLGSVALVVGAIGAANAFAGADAATPKPPAILYSLSTGDLRVAKVGARHTISIPASTLVTWFTDRPARRAGHTTARAFAGTWIANGFDTDPPNAALVLERGENTTTHVVTLRKPVLTGGRLTFTVTLIRDADEAGHRTTHPLSAGRARGSLFIDDAAYPPCNSYYGSYSDSFDTTGGCMISPGRLVLFGPEEDDAARVRVCSPDVLRSSTLLRLDGDGHRDGNLSPPRSWKSILLSVCPDSAPLFDEHDYDWVEALYARYGWLALRGPAVVLPG